MNRAERRQQRKLAQKAEKRGRVPSLPVSAEAGDAAPGFPPASKNPSELTEAGRRLHDAGDLDGAANLYRQALEISPDYPDALHLLGLVARGQGEFELAVKLISRAVKAAPRAAELHNNLGASFRDLGRYEDALASYRRAIALKPEFADGHHNLGLTLRDFGRTDEAAAELREAIALDPHFALAYRHLSNVLRFSPGDPEIEAMERLYADETIGDERRMHVAYALAKAYDDLGEKDRAWGLYIAANKLQRKTQPGASKPRGALGRMFQKVIDKIDLQTELSVVGYRNYVESMKSTFDESLFKRFADVGHRDKTPIFVVGMPRSGTTLTEQILASHSRVAGAGELSVMADLVRAFVERKSAGSLPEAVAMAEPGDFAEFGQAYVTALRKRGGKAPFIVDKMPSNYHFVGLIHLALPDAKIVHCHRDPRDMGLSIYKHYFLGPEYAYACDLAEIGGHFNLYAGLMAHWHAMLPGFVYDLRYEDMVADQRAETAALLEFCNLGWEDACLEFYETERPIVTDAERVRVPIHAGSVGAWKRYEKELAPLIDAMK